MCVSQRMPLTPPYVGVPRVSHSVRALRPAYVTAPTSCSRERRPLCVRDNQQPPRWRRPCRLASGVLGKKKKKLSARAHTDKQVLVDADLIDASAIANQNVISLKHSSLRRYTFEFLSLHFYILFYILIFFFTPLSLSHLSHRHTHCADDGSLEPRVKNSNKPLVHTTHSSETMLPDTLCHHPTHTCTHP